MKGRIAKEWKTIAVIIILLSFYMLYKSAFPMESSTGNSTPRKKTFQEVYQATPEPKKWEYKPTKVFPKEYYEIPKTLDNTCAPKHNLYFLRTHQTGTSSVTNIFYRYGREHNLDFVMYPLKLHLHYPNKMNLRYLESVRPDTGYNILCQYTRHKKMDIFRIMPEGTIFTTLLRHPVDQFLSVFHNFDIKSEIRNLQAHHNPYEEFFKHPEKIAMLSSDAVFHLIQNSMSFDLGLDPRQFKDEQAVDEFIKRVDEDFHLVLILELLDESLVLFRRLMCWKMSDMIHVKLSINMEYSSSISEDIRQKILNWNSVDYKLYSHFYEKMKKIISEHEDEEFRREVTMLRELNAGFAKECYAKVLPVYNGNKIGYTLHETHANNITCKTLATDDVTQTHIVGLRQFKTVLAPSDVMMVRNHMQNLRKNNMAMLQWADVNTVLHPIDDVSRSEEL